MIANAVRKVGLEQSPAQAADDILSRAVFHIFNDSPLGREGLLQSAFLAKQVAAPLVVYVPSATQCLLHGDGIVLTLNLGAENLPGRTTVLAHCEEIISEFDVDGFFYQPAEFTAGILPHLPQTCFIFTDPRAARAQAGWGGLGRAESRVRFLVRHLRRPVLMPATVFRPWTSVAAIVEQLAGANAIRAAMNLAERAGVPLSLHVSRTTAGGGALNSILSEVDADNVDLILHQGCGPAEYLYAVPRNSVVVVGAGKCSRFSELLFLNPLSRIRALLPNPLLVVDSGSRPCC